jgi:transposase-like protein
LGLWAAVGEVYPQAEQQLCWNHKMLNVMRIPMKSAPIPKQSGT